MERLTNLFFILMTMFLLVPPMFAEGGQFDVTYQELNECGKIVTRHGLYEDNVWASLFFLILALSCFIVPYHCKKMWKTMRVVAEILCGWLTSSFLFEIANFADPQVVYNTFDSNMIYPKFLTAFALTMIYIYTHTKWTSTKKY